MALTEKQLLARTRRLTQDISRAHRAYLRTRMGTKQQERAYDRLKTLENRMKSYRILARDFVESNTLLAEQKGIPKKAKLKKTH